MFFHDEKLQYELKVTTPNPVFANRLQQASDGQEGENKKPLTKGRWTSGPSLDGKAECRQRVAEPPGQEPVLASAISKGCVQNEQRSGSGVKEAVETLVNNVTGKA